MTDNKTQNTEPIPIFSFDSEDLMRSVLDMAEVEASFRAGGGAYTQGPFVLGEEGRQLAPGLNDLMKKTIGEHQLSEETQDRMQDEISKMAQAVFQQINEKEFEALVEAATIHIQRLTSPDRR